MEEVALLTTSKAGPQAKGKREPKYRLTVEGETHGGTGRAAHQKVFQAYLMQAIPLIALEIK